MPPPAAGALTPNTQAYVRNHNAAQVLNCLRLEGPLSRAELARRTGLNRSTISSIVVDLLDSHLIRETELQKGEVGRPGMSLEIDPDGGCAVGIEIGVGILSVLLADLVAHTIWEQRVPVDPARGQTAIIDQAEALVQAALDVAAAQGRRVFGIGLGIHGLVDATRGELRFAPNLKWRHVPLRQQWEARFGLPVFVENDANAAAMGEYYFGIARHIGDFIYLSTAVTGLGGGIVMNGQLYRGSSGYAGEIGHLTLDPHGELCGCGKRGCWETFLDIRRIIAHARAALADGCGAAEPGDSPAQAVSLLCAMTAGRPERLTFDQIVTAARDGDDLALDALRHVAEALGAGIANLANIFNPRLVVVGGFFAPFCDLLIPMMQETLRVHTLDEPFAILQVVASAHPVGVACPIGAVALVLDNVMRAPTLT